MILLSCATAQGCDETRCATTVGTAVRVRGCSNRIYLSFQNIYPTNWNICDIIADLHRSATSMLPNGREKNCGAFCDRDCACWPP
eukprot:SAG31_NODE_866_length_11370_cov_4.806761_2_plen_85_part_00